MKQLLHPQEVEVYYVLPTIRRHFAIALKERGMTQHEIAQLLQLQDAAVSQYISNKRGSHVDLDVRILADIGEAAKRITSTFDVLRETQHILHRIRETGGLCDIHKQFFNAPSNCTPQAIGCSVGETCHDRNSPRACH